MGTEDWAYLIARAKYIYSKNKFCSGVTKDDFVQYCAVSALKYQDKIPTFHSVKHFVISVVGYTAKNYYNSLKNSTTNHTKMWSTLRHEISLGEFLEDVAGDTSAEDFENALHLRMLCEKRLGPKEQEILELYKKGFTYKEIGEKFSLSSERIRQILEIIKKKLDKFNVLL